MCEEEKNNPGLVLKARQTVRREAGISSGMPGYEALVRAIVRVKLDNEEHFGNSAKTESGVSVQSEVYNQEEKDVERLQMLEVMKMAQAKYDDLDEFVEELAGIC